MDELTKAAPMGWGGYKYFLGLDWAQAHHAIVVLRTDPADATSHRATSNCNLSLGAYVWRMLQ